MSDTYLENNYRAMIIYNGSYDYYKRKVYCKSKSRALYRFKGYEQFSNIIYPIIFWYKLNACLLLYMIINIL